MHAGGNDVAPLLGNPERTPRRGLVDGCDIVDRIRHQVKALTYTAVPRASPAVACRPVGLQARQGRSPQQQPVERMAQMATPAARRVVEPHLDQAAYRFDLASEAAALGEMRQVAITR